MAASDKSLGSYDPKQIEQKWYELWEERGYFHADPASEKPPYTIVIPPPNVTGSLHMGHALNNTLQDVLVRYKRMDGFEALWMPGTDHAGIATQNVVERMLAAEGVTRHDIGREEFIERVWKWKAESGGTIIKQLRSLGATCDWERERFTMDEGLSRSVREVFCSLYEQDLIYKGDYIINWCPRCHTALSELEVEHADGKGHLWHLKYPFTDGSGEVVVATTRPETMLGDTAIAVHPDDERYKGLMDKEIILPIIGRRIKFIADSFVDPEFGTGAVKVTPAHDPNDFAMGLRHDLERVNVIGEDGAMTEAAGKYAGMDRYECRKALVADLEAEGVLLKVDDHDHAVGSCYRCATVIEPLVSKQWFVRIEPLAKKAIDAVRDGRTRIVPAQWEKTYFHWMENIRDWCISRQIWWGHRIPAYTCVDCGEMVVSRTDVTSCPKCGGAVEQETDVLDTWFSSGLWPFSTMGWPDKTPELKKFYPTSVLVTGFDILFFWVARMMMMGLWFMDEVPFTDVYIHALVRDDKGEKMSKTRGNVIDPLEVIDEFGADAFRFGLVAFAAQGRDIRLSKGRIEGYQRFANKIWNAARFIMMNLEDFDTSAPRVEFSRRSSADRWILTRLKETVTTVRSGLDEYRFNDAASAIYQFTWHEFCDWYVEMSKRPLYAEDGDTQARLAAQQTLIEVFDTLMRLVHPFMPFISEELWLKLPWPTYLDGRAESLMIADFPKAEEIESDTGAQVRMEKVKEVVSAIRNIRGEMNVPPSRKIEVIVQGAAGPRGVIEEEVEFVRALAAAGEVSFIDVDEAKPPKAAQAVAAELELFLPLAGLIDLDEEEKRLQKEIAKLEGDADKVMKKLENPQFVDKAPAAVVEKEKARAVELADNIAKLREGLARITGQG